jgi:nucleoside-diphosphate-sugar epimerase
MNKKFNSKKTRILITGANGFLGSNLTIYLSKDPTLEVHAMVRPNAPINFLRDFQYKSNMKDKWFEFVEASLLNKESINRAVKNKDVIVHLAGLVNEWAKWDAQWNLNVDGTRTILQAASRDKVSRILFLSSLAVHGKKGNKYSTEEAPRDVKNFPYGETKKIAEDLVSEWDMSNSSVDSAIIRPGYIIYGPYDKRSFILSLEALDSGVFGLINGGKKLVSYVYVENLCYGIKQLIKAPKISGAYNILDGNITWKEWYSIWAEALEKKPPKLSVPYPILVPITALMVGIYRLFGIKKSPPLNFYRINVMRRDRSFVNKRISKEIGYERPIKLEEGIKRTIDYYMKTKRKKE